LSAPQQPEDLGPIKPYPILGDKCRTCSTRPLLVIHDTEISHQGAEANTFVCEACDTPDPRFTLGSLKLDVPRA
jgi:hypothetical protein